MDKLCSDIFMLIWYLNFENSNILSELFFKNTFKQLECWLLVM